MESLGFNTIEQIIMSGKNHVFFPLFFFCVCAKIYFVAEKKLMLAQRSHKTQEWKSILKHLQLLMNTFNILVMHRTCVTGSCSHIPQLKNNINMQIILCS